MWIWYGDPVYRYRDELGRFAAQETVWNYADRSITETQKDVGPLAYDLESGVLDLSQWEQTMRDTITKEILRQYLLGIGGDSAMGPDDYAIVEELTQTQFDFLSGFSARIANGEYSPAKIAAISKMYINSAGKAFEQASAKVRGLPEMPIYPKGDGVCLGLVNCGCHWEYHFRNGRWECYWVMNPAKENCELCIDHAQEWNPLIVEVT